MWFKKDKKKEISSLYDDIDYSMVTVKRYTEERERYIEQGYMEFPERDRLYYRKENINEYRNNPITDRLINHYQPFFEKGIDYVSNGKNYNCYLRSSNLFYFNEAFSLCTKLSIDPSPEEYFIQEYYYDMSIPDIERYFVLSIVYVLLACNGLVRKQHLKMIDLLDNFLRSRCPSYLRTMGFLFIIDQYNSGEIPFWEFKPVIDKWGNMLLNVDEGLPDNQEEQVTLINQMRHKVEKHIYDFKNKIEAYTNMNNKAQQNNGIPEDDKTIPLKVRLKALTEIMKQAGVGTDSQDMTKVARMAAMILGNSYDYIYKLMSKGFDFNEKTHGEAIEETNKLFKDLNSTIQIKS